MKDHHGNVIPEANYTKRQLWELVVSQGGKANISNAGHEALDAEISAYPYRKSEGAIWNGRRDTTPGWSRTPRKDADYDGS